MCRLRPDESTHWNLSVKYMSCMRQPWESSRVYELYASRFFEGLFLVNLENWVAYMSCTQVDCLSRLFYIYIWYLFILFAFIQRDKWGNTSKPTLWAGSFRSTLEVESCIWVVCESNIPACSFRSALGMESCIWVVCESTLWAGSFRRTLRVESHVWVVYLYLFLFCRCFEHVFDS